MVSSSSFNNIFVSLKVQLHCGHVLYCIFVSHILHILTVLSLRWDFYLGQYIYLPEKGGKKLQDKSQEIDRFVKPCQFSGLEAGKYSSQRITGFSQGFWHLGSHQLSPRDLPVSLEH